tara:strand:- start:283 stop:762 length:480 start_codon:yes stop_codon:yes gene_type:complete
MRIFLFIVSISFFHLNLSANSISIFGGSYDYDDDNTSTLYGLNYHLSDNAFSVFNLIDFNPVIGGFVTAKSATMIYSGFETNIGKDSIYLNLSSSAGIYSNGDGKDLGNTLQFKSEVNLFYRVGNSSRVGLGSHHISNAGLSSVNPGTNNFYLIFNRDF